MTTLTKQRRKIDKINQKLLKLLSKRMESSQKIGNFKKSHSSMITDKEREEKMLRRISRQSKKYHLNEQFINTVFQEILNESKRLQKNKQ
jgi:chorismate mutase